MSKQVSYDTRISIDTLYIGLLLLEEEIKPFFENIKNYLSFKRQLVYNFDYSRNRFYKSEIVCESRGFYSFFDARKRTNNAPVTVQLTGKFFKNIKEAMDLVNFLVSFDVNRIQFQRVDVALDVLYKDVSEASLCVKSNTLGFPWPSYSSSWRYNRIPFTTYGRCSDYASYINMVSQGKNDVIMRVYDKTLDLLEKYKETYSEYYSLKKQYEQAFRIELQLRGDKLKSLVDSVFNTDINFSEYESICYICYHYLMQKFVFEGYNFDFDITDFALNHHKDKSSAASRAAYHKRMMTHHYRCYCDEWDNLKIQEDMDYIPLSMRVLNDKLVDCNNDIEASDGCLDFYKEFKQGVLPF